MRKEDMNTLTRKSRFLAIAVLLAVLSLGQLVNAQGPDPEHTKEVRGHTEVPQWVIDRQQYETTYVYVPSVGDMQPAGIAACVPKWVIDRQQYETTYFFVVPTSDSRPAEIAPSIPQWVIDRQQYETTYKYVP
jgi:hypothetical protein